MIKLQGNTRFISDMRSTKKVIGFLGYYPLGELKTLGERIKKYRNVKGLTLEEFGVLVGTDDTTVWTWENGL
jgi:hypothetical protein